MPTEGSAGSAGREATSTEQSERDAEGQVSSAKQFATGAKRGQWLLIPGLLPPEQAGGSLARSRIALVPADLGTR